MPEQHQNYGVKKAEVERLNGDLAEAGVGREGSVVPAHGQVVRSAKHDAIQKLRSETLLSAQAAMLDCLE